MAARAAGRRQAQQRRRAKVVQRRCGQDRARGTVACACVAAAAVANITTTITTILGAKTLGRIRELKVQLCEAIGIGRCAGARGAKHRLLELRRHPHELGALCTAPPRVRRQAVDVDAECIQAGRSESNTTNAAQTPA